MKPKSRADDFSKSNGSEEPGQKSLRLKDTGVDRLPQPFRAMILEPVLQLRGESAQTELRGNRSPEARLEEALGLSAAINLNIAHSGVVRVNNPKPATLFGDGKVAELAGIVASEIWILLS